MKQNVWILTILALIGLFLVLSSEVQSGEENKSDFVKAMDQLVFHKVQAMRHPSLSIVATDITALGSRSVLALAVLGFSVFMAMIHRFDLMIHGIVASIGGGCLTLALKSLYLRERPPQGIRLVEVQGYSYPSGHMLSASATYLTLAFLACYLFDSRTHRQVVLGMALLLVSLIGFTRVYLGVHFPSDVLAGLFLGAAWAMLLKLLGEFVIKKRDLKRSLDS